MTFEEHRQVLDDLERRAHQDRLAELHHDLAQAQASGHTWLVEFHQGRIERLKALPKPWEREPAA